MISVFPDRKPIRLNPLNYLGLRHYFVTICCCRRNNIFLNPKLSDWLLGLLRSESFANSFSVHAYCLMPDHLHLLTEGIEPTSDLRHFIKSFRIKSSRQYATESGGVVWQKRFYEHILRSSAEVESVCWYIWLNPVRKGLCREAREYPFVGSFTALGKRLLKGSIKETWTPPWKGERTS